MISYYKIKETGNYEIGEALAVNDYANFYLSYLKNMLDKRQINKRQFKMLERRLVKASDMLGIELEPVNEENHSS